MQQVKQTEDQRNAAKKADEQMAKLTVENMHVKISTKHIILVRDFCKDWKKRGKFAK